MPRFRDFLARLAGRPRPLYANVPAALDRVERENDVFAELVAASSFLDFGGAPIEFKLKETDLNAAMVRFARTSRQGDGSDRCCSTLNERSL
jgi:hypothetical protein